MKTTKILLAKNKTLYVYNEPVGVTGSFYNFKDDLEIEIDAYGTEQSPSLFNLRLKTGSTYISLWGDKYEIEQ